MQLPAGSGPGSCSWTSTRSSRAAVARPAARRAGVEHDRRGYRRARVAAGRRRVRATDGWTIPTTGCVANSGAALDDGKRIDLIVRAKTRWPPPAKALPEPLVRLASIQSTHRLHSASWPDDVNAIERLLAAWGLRDEEPDVPATPEPEPEKRDLPPVSEIELVARLKEMPYSEARGRMSLPREHPRDSSGAAAFLPVRLLRGGHRVHVCDGSALYTTESPSAVGQRVEDGARTSSTWDADNRITSGRSGALRGAR